jgi:hypothetical protein
MTDTLPPRPARRRRPLQRPRPRIGGRRACPLRPPVSVSCLNYRPVAPGSATLSADDLGLEMRRRLT